MSDPRASANEFERDKPSTNARSDAEAAIEDLRKRGGIFVEAVRATRMAMALTDPTLPGNPIVFANQSFLDLSGYSVEEVLGQQPYFMNGADTDPEDAERFRRILEEDRDGVIETVQYDKDGRRFVATVLLTAFKDDAGKTLHHFLSWADVTRRVDAEEDAAVLRKTKAALRESEQQFETLLANAPLGIYLVDQDFVIRHANPVALRVFGDIPGGPIGRDFDEVIHILWEKNYADEVVGIFRHTLETGEAYSTPERAEYRIDRDTSEYYEWRLDRIALPGGRHGVVCYFRDISTQVEARKEIEKGRKFARESEARLQSALSISTVGVLFWGPEFSLTQVNSAFLRMTGFTREEAIGKTWQELTPPEFHPSSERAVEELRHHGEATPFEKQYYRKDGSRWWGLFAPRRLSESEVVEFVIDITERRQAEETLRESEERLRRFGEASQDILWIRDAETLQWTYLTPAFETIYGLSREEALEGDNYRSWLDLILPEDREKADRSIERVRAGEHVVFEYRVKRPSDGAVRWLRNTDFPVHNTGGKVSWIGGIGHDITELRESGERARLLLAELQHRVRNIMAMIRSVARRTGDTTESVEDYVQHLEGRISAMARTQTLLTRDVHAAVDLQSLLLDELEMQAAQPDRYRVTGPDVSLPAKAAEVLGLALHELATNAVKYGALSTKGGRIDVRWALLEGEKLPHLSLIWSEFGVKIDGEPIRQGFGTELITQRVPYELQGTGTMEFRPTGLVATLEFPLADLPSILQTDEGKQTIS